MKHTKDEAVVNAVKWRKMRKHEIAVHVKKTRFSEKDIQQAYSAITCIECKKRLFSIKFNNHLVL